MRSRLLLLALAVALTAGAAPSGSPQDGREEAAPPSLLTLEIPEFGGTRHPPGVLRLPDPGRIRRIVVHIPSTRVFRVFPKINAIGTGLVHTLRARRDEVLCEIDFSLHEGRFYALSRSDNTVEIKVLLEPGAEPVYARWVIAPPSGLDAWQTHQQLAEAPAPLAAAQLGSEGLVLKEELEDGQRVNLEQGVTSAHRIIVEASFPRSEESVSMRLRWNGEEDRERTFSVGGSQTPENGRGVRRASSDAATLEAAIELTTGENRLEVEVLHGYTPHYRRVFRILRRRPTEPGAVSGDKWAVIIGISDYRDPRLELEYARSDAESIRELLLTRGGFSRDRVRILTDGAATHEGIRTALFTFLASTQPDDMVLIFLAGHGVQDTRNPDNFFFLGHDSDLDNLGGTAIPLWDFDNVMDYTIRARRVVVLADTCHSGSVIQSASAGGDAPLNFFNSYLEVLARRKGRLVLTASQAHEVSLESDRLGGGVFTHFLLRGLEGEADDNPADGVVTAEELVDYVRATVPRETGGEQHPSHTVEAFDMNLPLAYVKQTE